MGRSKPRIGVTAFGSGGPGTGLWTYLRHVVRALERQSRFSVELVGKRPILDALPLEGRAVTPIPVDDAPERALRDLLWHQRALPQLAAERGWDLLFAPVDRRCPFRAPCPRVATVHDLSAFRLRGKYGRARGVYNRLLLPRALSGCRRLLCDSAATRDDLHHFTPIPPERSVVVPLGVDAERFAPDPGSDDTAIRERHGLPERFILYTSRLEHPAKRHQSLLRAFATLPDPELGLALAGPRWRGAEAIDREIARLGLGGRVKLLGYVPHEELPALFRQASVFAFPSEAEGFGLPVLEAMAAGTPVVCRRSPAVAEVAGNAALFWEDDDPATLGALLQRVLGDRSEADRLRRAGTRRVRAYEWQRCEDGLVDALADVLGLVRQPEATPRCLEARG